MNGYYLFISFLLLAELFDDCIRLGWMANNQAIRSFVRKQWHQVDAQQVSQLTQLDFLYFLDKLPLYKISYLIRQNSKFIIKKHSEFYAMASILTPLKMQLIE
jgi:hypothetical protein